MITRYDLLQTLEMHYPDERDWRVVDLHEGKLLVEFDLTGDELDIEVELESNNIELVVDNDNEA